MLTALLLTLGAGLLAGAVSGALDAWITREVRAARRDAINAMLGEPSTPTPPDHA